MFAADKTMFANSLVDTVIQLFDTLLYVALVGQAVNLSTYMFCILLFGKLNPLPATAAQRKPDSSTKMHMPVTSTIAFWLKNGVGYFWF